MGLRARARSVCISIAWASALPVACSSSGSDGSGAAGGTHAAGGAHAAGASTAGAPSSVGGSGIAGSASNGSGAPGAGAPAQAAGASGAAGANTAGASGAGAVPAGSAGCGKAGAKSGTYTLTTMVGGVSRSYDVQLEGQYDSNKPIPLVLGFHGAGGNAQAGASFGLQAAAMAAGNAAVFAFPNGVAQGNNGIGWDLACKGNDVAFYDAILKELEADYCIDTTKVYEYGFSWGGDMSNTLACCRGDTLRGTIVISGALYISTGDCTAKTPAFRLTTGTADPNYSVDDFTRGLKHAQTSNHCGDTLAAVSPEPCQAYPTCDHPVVWCSYAGMGHQAPPNWATETWSFLTGLK